MSVILSGAMAVVGGMGGCAGDARIGDGPQYPTVDQSGVVDVQVRRNTTQITLTNTTPTTLGPGRLWLNQWFSREIGAIESGATVTFELSDFKDRYDDAFRAGGFFATQVPAKLVLAQIERDGVLTGLVVVGDGATGL
jgi:hypothetical protein